MCRRLTPIEDLVRLSFYRHNAPDFEESWGVYCDRCVVRARLEAGKSIYVWQPVYRAY
jgi:hypothetical protein